MLSKTGFIFLISAFFIGFAWGDPLPSFVKVCKRNDPKLDQCILNTVEELKPHLKHGIPELGVPALEPFEIPEIGLDGNNKQNFTAIGRNIKVYGCTNFKVDKFHVDLSNEENPKFTTTVFLPKLDIEGDYEINAKLPVLPIKGKGSLKFTAIKTKADATMSGEIYKKDGAEYLKFTNMDLNIDLEDYDVHLDNLFNGDKILEDATNQALNDNKEKMKQALIPTVTKVASDYMMKMANKIASHQSLDVLLPK